MLPRCKKEGEKEVEVEIETEIEKEVEVDVETETETKGIAVCVCVCFQTPEAFLAKGRGRDGNGCSRFCANCQKLLAFLENIFEYLFDFFEKKPCKPRQSGV